MYFCRHCGYLYETEDAVICIKCGCPKGQGENYCCNCGKPTQSHQDICLACGIDLKKYAAKSNRYAKSRQTAGLLGILCGFTGAHNFYLGYTTKAIIQVVLSVIGLATACIYVGLIPWFASCIWGLVEGIMIFSGSINVDGNGNPLID